MKTYPSIPRATGQKFREFKAHIFDKLDGNNIRTEWTRKQGWHKFGTRKRLLDESDELYGPSIPLFFDTLAELLERYARDSKLQQITVFSEYWGPKSLAGMHQNDDDMRLTLFDVCIYKKGFVDPITFLKTFNHLDIPEYLGYHNFTRDFVHQVREDLIPGVTHEGVIAKSGSGTAKAKTQKWIDAVIALYGEKEAKKFIES